MLPVISSFTPEGDVVLGVGGSQEFSIVVSDADNDELSMQWYVDSLPVAGQNSTSFTFQAEEPGGFEVKILVTDNMDYVTHKWAVAVSNETSEGFSITGAFVSTVNNGRNSLLDWLRGLF